MVSAEEMLLPVPWHAELAELLECVSKNNCYHWSTQRAGFVEFLSGLLILPVPSAETPCLPWRVQLLPGREAVSLAATPKSMRTSATGNA